MQLTRRAALEGVAALAVATLAGCSSRSEEQAAQDDAQATATTEETTTEAADATATDATAADTSADAAADDGQAEASAGSNVLVAYFSRAGENYGPGGAMQTLEVGNTKVMASYIVEALGADEYEIVPTEAYPDSYDECLDVAKQEQAADDRPAIANALPDVSAYDTVFVGCPIWWGDEPMIIRTFLEGVDLSDKVVVPFTTHAGSGLGSVPSNLAAALPNSLLVEGHAVAGADVSGAHDEVTSWAQGAVG